MTLYCFMGKVKLQSIWWEVVRKLLVILKTTQIIVGRIKNTYISVFNFASMFLFVYLLFLSCFVLFNRYLKQPITILVVICCSTKIEVRCNKTLPRPPH